MVFLLTATLVLPTVRGETATVFSDFDDWWQQYTTVPAAERAGVVKKGISLAKTRRDAMLALIENDPAKAIQMAFAEEYHSALPKPIGELVELHVRGLAKLTVTKKKDGTAQRNITMEGKTYKAHLYGARLELNSRAEIPIHGVELEGQIAVDGSPLERFPNRETLLNVLRQSEGKKTCPICNEPGTIPTAVGDILLWFDTEAHLNIVEKALIEKEASPETSS